MTPHLRIVSSDVVSKGLLVGINLYLIQRLDIDEYAHFTLMLSAVLLGYQLACGPLERLYIAEHDRYRAHLTSLRWVLSMVSALGGVLWLWRTSAWSDMLMLFIGVFVLAAHQTIKIRLQQRLDFTFFSIAEVLKSAMWALLLVPFLSLPFIQPGAAGVLALILATLLSVALLRLGGGPRMPGPEDRRPFSEIARVLWDTRYVLAYSLMGAVVPYLPVMMAEASSSNTVTATYGAAMRYQAILGMAVFAFNTVLLPQMAALRRDDRDRAQLMQRLKGSAPMVLVIFVAVAAAIWFAIPYVDGGKYPLLPQIFALLAVTPALSMISTPYINMLLVDGRAATVFACMAAGLVVNTAGFALLGSSSESLAPAWASVLAYLAITLAVVACATVRRRPAA